MFFERKVGEAGYAYVVLGTHGIGLWAVASRSVRQRGDERPSGQNRRHNRSREHSEFPARRKLQKGLRLPFPSALRIHRSHGL